MKLNDKEMEELFNLAYCVICKTTIINPNPESLKITYYSICSENFSIEWFYKDNKVHITISSKKRYCILLDKDYENNIGKTRLLYLVTKEFIMNNKEKENESQCRGNE